MSDFKQIKEGHIAWVHGKCVFKPISTIATFLSEAGQCFSQYMPFSLFPTHQIESFRRVSCRFELIFGNGVRTGYIMCVTHCVWCCFCARRNYDPGLHKSQAWRQYDVGTGTEIRACTYCTPSTF